MNTYMLHGHSLRHEITIEYLGVVFFVEGIEQSVDVGI